MSDGPLNLDGKSVWVAGHRGMVGSSIVRRLDTEPVAEVVTATSSDVDLTRQEATESFVRDVAPDIAIIAAARVGGIRANRDGQAEFLQQNLLISMNCIDACYRAGVEKVVILGSSCIYPRDAPQPINEDALLSGPLEPTNEGYAIAKIAGLELAKMYRRQHGFDAISLMPTNLYGPNDNFDLETSHVLPALLRKIHDARIEGRATVEVWGSGRPRREFLHVDDLADATVFALRHHSGEQHLNVGTGVDISIRGLAEQIAQVVGWDGEFVFDRSMPDGTFRKLLDVSRMAELGWAAHIGLAEGLKQTYEWFCEQGEAIRGGGKL